MTNKNSLEEGISQYNEGLKLKENGKEIIRRSLKEIIMDIITKDSEITSSDYYRYGKLDAGYDFDFLKYKLEHHKDFDKKVIDCLANGGGKNFYEIELSLLLIDLETQKKLKSTGEYGHNKYKLAEKQE
jgi:hypothetical protein